MMFHSKLLGAVFWLRPKMFQMKLNGSKFLHYLPCPYSIEARKTFNGLVFSIIGCSDWREKGNLSGGLVYEEPVIEQNNALFVQGIAGDAAGGILQLKLAEAIKKKMAAFTEAKICPRTISTTNGIFRTENGHKLQSRSEVRLSPREVCRRHLLRNGISLVSLLAFNSGFSPLLAWAEEMSSNNQRQDKGVIEVIKTIFDPNEKTKSGKELPKAYLKSAREVVKTLRESLQEDPKDGAKFRQTADAAKDSIRDYLSNWLGQQKVVQEESYVVLEKAIRSLASFYAKAGPSAPLPEDVKSDILNDLAKAEEFL